MSEFAEEILRRGEMLAPDGSRIALTGSVSQREGLFLQSLVRELKPAVSLEVGLAFGTSALFLCEELQKVGAQRHIVIDPFQSSEFMNVGLENLRREGFSELIEFHEGPSHLELPRLLSRGEKIDFAFIDGSHAFDCAFLDFFYVDRLLRVGGVIAFDDANWPGVRKVIRYILTNRTYSHLASLPKHLSLPKLLARYGSLRAIRELVVDRRLGLAVPHSRCVALVKQGESDSPPGFQVSERELHHDF